MHVRAVAHLRSVDLIVTPCPLCQANVAVYQSEINQRHGTRLATPVTYYSPVMTVADGGTAKKAGLDGHLIQFAKLQESAAKLTK